MNLIFDSPYLQITFWIPLQELVVMHFAHTEDAAKGHVNTCGIKWFFHAVHKRSAVAALKGRVFAEC